MELFLENTLELALVSAPWLLFGLVAAGLIRAWLPMELVGRSLGGSGLVRRASAPLFLRHSAGGHVVAPFRGIPRLHHLVSHIHPGNRD